MPTGTTREGRSYQSAANTVFCDCTYRSDSSCSTPFTLTPVFKKAVGLTTTVHESNTLLTEIIKKFGPQKCRVPLWCHSLRGLAS